jgi:hypothetical protein
MAFPDDWDNSVERYIHGSVDGALTDYVMIGITIYYQPGMNTDFSDIRFVDSDGVTQLNYNITSYTSSDNATVDLLVPSIPADPDTKTVYLYFGNSEATDASSPEDTYPLYEDFSGTTLDTDVWSVVSGTPVVNDKLTLTNSIIKTKTSYGNGYEAIVSLKAPDTSSVARFGFEDNDVWTSASNYSAFQLWNGTYYTDTKKDRTKTETSRGSYDTSTHSYRIIRSSSSSATFYIDSTSYEHTTHIPTASMPVYLRGDTASHSFEYYSVIIIPTTANPPVWGVYNTSTEFQSLIIVNEEDYIDWQWQNEIEITGSVDGQLTDYCVNVTVPYDNEFMRYDFGDIRFGTDYGLNLPYFRRQMVEGDFAEYIVKIPVIPASPETITIYLYAGNDQAQDRSDGLNTFEFFDHFDEGYTPELDTDKWTYTTNGVTTANIDDSVLTLEADLPGHTTKLISKTSFGENHILGVRAKFSTPGGSCYASFGFDNDSTRYAKEYLDQTTSKFNVNDAGSEDTGDDHRSSFTPTDYYVYEIQNKPTNGISENIDFTPVDDSTVNITTAMPVEFKTYALGTAQYIYVDYVYVRHAIDNEPSIGELGTWATTQHTAIYQSLLEIPYWEDYQALICISPLSEDFQALLSITGYEEELIKALINITGAPDTNYIYLYKALVEINADASNHDAQAIIRIGNVRDGFIEVHGKILYNGQTGNYNSETTEGLNVANQNIQFVMKLGGRIYG